MEHVVQFGINVDDERIKQAVLDSAEKKIMADIERDVCDKLFASSLYYGGHSDPKRDGLSSFSERIVDEFLERNKESIIDTAAKYLADKLARTKAAKEIIIKQGD